MREGNIRTKDPFPVWRKSQNQFLLFQNHIIYSLWTSVSAKSTLISTRFESVSKDPSFNAQSVSLLTNPSKRKQKQIKCVCRLYLLQKLCHHNTPVPMRKRWVDKEKYHHKRRQTCWETFENTGYKPLQTEFVNDYNMMLPCLMLDVTYIPRHIMLKEYASI